MTSSAIEREELGAATLARKWWLDVNVSATSTPEWVGVFGISEFKPGLTPTLEDDGDYDGGGYGSQSKTGLAWANEFKVNRKVSPDDPETYDPGQEALRLAGEQFGPLGIAHVRWYEMTEGGPRTEAYEGRAEVTWAEDGGGRTALSKASVTLTGRGKRIPIAHPAGA